MPCPKCAGVRYLSGPSDEDPDIIEFWFMENGCGHRWEIDYRIISAEIQKCIREVMKKISKLRMGKPGLHSLTVCSVTPTQPDFPHLSYDNLL